MVEHSSIPDTGVLPSQSSLGHIPSSRWEFDEEVTNVFADMLSRSIPHIGAMRDIVGQLGRRLIQPNTHIVDLGCSTGDAIAPLLADPTITNPFVAIELSEPMLKVTRERLGTHLEGGRLELSNMDLRSCYPEVHASLTLCILTLQFIPIEHRQRLLADAYATTLSGGGLILVEKVLGESATTSSLLTSQYYEHKRRMGYSEAAIEAKRVALQGVLVPLTASWNEQLLRNAGFRHVECIWRCLNFCGWVAIA